MSFLFLRRVPRSKDVRGLPTVLMPLSRHVGNGIVVWVWSSGRDPLRPPVFCCSLASDAVVEYHSSFTNMFGRPIVVRIDALSRLGQGDRVEYLRRDVRLRWMDSVIGEAKSWSVGTMHYTRTLPKSSSFLRSSTWSRCMHFWQ